jgi:hypothetical protein
MTPPDEVPMTDLVRHPPGDISDMCTTASPNYLVGGGNRNLGMIKYREWDSTVGLWKGASDVGRRSLGNVPRPGGSQTSTPVVVDESNLSAMLSDAADDTTS